VLHSKEYDNCDIQHCKPKPQNTHGSKNFSFLTFLFNFIFLRVFFQMRTNMNLQTIVIHESPMEMGVALSH
jgi:hypothetical protein